MKVYAERPVRVLGQLLGDVLLIAWVGAWIWFGLEVHDRLNALQRPTAQVGQVGKGLADSLAETSDQIRSLQFVGDALAAPFDAIINGSRQLVDASTNTRAAIGGVADISVWLAALFPVLFAVLLWAVVRVRWMRHATSAAKLRASGMGDGLLAAQALTTARMDRLVEYVGPGNPLDDPYSRKRLAAYQLRRLGLRDHAPGDPDASEPTDRLSADDV